MSFLCSWCLPTNLKKTLFLSDRCFPRHLPAGSRYCRFQSKETISHHSISTGLFWYLFLTHTYAQFNLLKGSFSISSDWSNRITSFNFQFIFITAALFIAISRVMDFKHHPGNFLCFKDCGKQTQCGSGNEPFQG